MKSQPDAPGQRSGESQIVDRESTYWTGRIGVILLGLAVGATAMLACQQLRTTPPVVVAANLDELDAQVQAHIRKYIRAAEANPQRAAGHSDLGLAYAGNKLWEAAAACFATASELSYRDPLPGYYHAIAMANLSKPQKTLSLLRETTLEFLDFAPAHHRLGVQLLYQGNVAEASRAFERVIALAPDAAEGYAGLGECRLLIENYFESVPLLEKALQLAPRVRKTHYLLGRAYLKTGRQTEAAEHLAKGVNSQVRYMVDPWSHKLKSHMKILAARGGSPAGRVAGAVGPDVRRPDAGDVEHRRGGATQQMGLRRP